MMLDLTAVNLWAVLVAAVANMVLGATWYGPLFAKAWMAEVGLTEADFERKQAEAKRGYIVSMIGSVIQAYVLAVLLGGIGAATVGAGSGVGALAGVGLVATTDAANYAFEDRSVRIYLINVGYAVVGLAVMGAIIAAWT